MQRERYGYVTCNNTGYATEQLSFLEEAKVKSPTGTWNINKTESVLPFPIIIIIIILVGQMSK